MSALVTLRSAIIADLEASITDANTVEAYGGRLNLGEIKRITKRPPAILLALVNGNSSAQEAADPIRVDMLISAFVIAEDERGRDRDVVALSIAEQVITRAAKWQWRGTVQASAPSDLKLESLYSGELDRKGVALLAVAWKQTVPIGTDRFEAERLAADLPDFADPDGLAIAGAADGIADPEMSDA